MFLIIANPIQSASFQIVIKKVSSSRIQIESFIFITASKKIFYDFQKQELHPIGPIGPLAG